jgi:two-component SAPR family response regulator
MFILQIKLSRPAETSVNFYTRIHGITSQAAVIFIQSFNKYHPNYLVEPLVSCNKYG